MHHNCLVSEGIRKNVREVHLYVNLHIFVFCYILQFNDKTNYDKVLSYQILTDNNYTFPLAPWSDDARCQTQAWKVPITIDVHGIPPYAFHIKSLSVLLDPYCDIETCTMDKKTGICTVEGTALSVNSIPNTGFLSYPRRTGYETVIHTFPVTMKTSLLSVQKKTPLIGYHLLPSMYTHTMKIHLTLKVTIITPLQQVTIPKTLFITLSFQIQKKI